MFKTKLAYETWKSKYRFGNETPLGTFQRVARALASVEKDPEFWYQKFLNILIRISDTGDLDGLKNTAGGRITANVGTSFKKATLINCYVSGPVSNAHIKYNRKSDDGSLEYPVEYQTDDTPDDLINIFLTIVEQAKTLASEGGYGICFDFIRPRGSLIKGTGVKHPGVVAYMRIWDAVSTCIVQGDMDGYNDKIKNYLKEDFEEVKDIVKAMPRKGAMLASLSCEHPDCEEFIRAKQLSGELTKFNISVVLTEKFLKAVEADGLFDQTFNGKVIKRVKARELFDLIMSSCYQRAEPGVLFADNMMKNNPVAYLGKPTSCNPCVRRGTLVSTSKGLVPVDQISKTDSIQTTLGFEPVENIEIHENIDIFRVTFSDKSYLDVSEGHIFHSQDTKGESRKHWNNTKRLNSLSVGDFIRKDRYRFETHNSPTFTRDMGLFAGLFLGDGHIDANNNVCISVDQREDSSYIFILCEKFGFKYWLDDSASDGFSRKIIISGGGSKNNKAKDVLKTMGLDVELKAPQKTFPYEWINTNKEFLKGLLDGLICSDGNVNDRSKYPQIRFKNTSLNLHNMLRHVMLYFGADYKIYEGEKAGEEHLILGRSIKRKHTIYEGIIDNDSILNFYHELNYLSHPQKNKTLKEIIKSTSLCGVKWKTKIESIELIGKDTVYDLYAKDADDWNTCGIVSRGCGEIPGLAAITTVCLLGSVNLTMYIKIKDGKPYFDFEEYAADIRVFLRALDNVNDLTYSPLPSYAWVIENLRQVGMGINGLGSALMMLGIPYNSPEAVEFTKNVCQIKENLTWQTSALLAKEKGTFPAYDKEKFESTEYFNSDRITEETRELMRKYGVRNAKTTTCPPLGNSSIISDITSNGVEPVFLLEYDRKIICKEWPEGLDVENIKEKLKHKKEKDYEYWYGEFKGQQYYYEPHNRGLCEVSTVRDYGYQWVLDNFPDQKKKWPGIVTTQDLNIQDHLNIQSMVQYYNNQSTSKTLNLSNDFNFEDFKGLYLKAWKLGLNGFTTYREGSMESVLSGIAQAEKREIIAQDIKLPDDFLNGPTQIIKREGKKFYLHFSYLPEDSSMAFPIVLWIYTNAKYKTNELRICNKAARNLGKLALKCGVISRIVKETIDKANEDYPHNRLGRMVSLCLRHNIPREDILVSIMNIDGDNISTLLTSVRKFLSKTLEDGIELKGLKCPSCEGQMVMAGGCSQCLDCGEALCQ